MPGIPGSGPGLGSSETSPEILRGAHSIHGRGFLGHRVPRAQPDGGLNDRAGPPRLGSGFPIHYHALKRCKPISSENSHLRYFLFSRTLSQQSLEQTGSGQIRAHAIGLRDTFRELRSSYSQERGAAHQAALCPLHRAVAEYVLEESPGGPRHAPLPEGS